jgi:glycosyltransferase involved in cell wall biosynthesis
VRVLVVSPYPPQTDGIGGHARNLEDALAPYVEVAILTRVGAPGTEPTGPHIHRALAADPRALRPALEAARVEHPAVIHYQFNIPALGLAWIPAILVGVRERRRGGARLVFTMHEVRRDTTLVGPVGKTMYRLLARIADGLIVYTEEARDLLVERCGVARSKITVMPHGAPAAYPAPSPEARAALDARYDLTGRLVLYFGYIHTDKGIDVLVEALGRLRASRPELLE